MGLCAPPGPPPAPTPSFMLPWYPHASCDPRAPLVSLYDLLTLTFSKSSGQCPWGAAFNPAIPGVSSRLEPGDAPLARPWLTEDIRAGPPVLGLPFLGMWTLTRQFPPCKAESSSRLPQGRWSEADGEPSCPLRPPGQRRPHRRPPASGPVGGCRSPPARSCVPGLPSSKRPRHFEGVVAAPSAGLGGSAATSFLGENSSAASRRCVSSLAPRPALGMRWKLCRDRPRSQQSHSTGDPPVRQPASSQI